MITRYRKGTSALTIFTVVAFSLVFLQVNLIASSSSSASAKLLAGTLYAHGTTTVTVNGNQSISGTTILPGTELATSEKSIADVQLGGLGSFEMGPNSRLAVSFGEKGVEIALNAGFVVLTTNEGINGSVTTPDGRIVRTDSARVSSVMGRVGESAASLAVDAAKGGGDDSDHGSDTGEGLLGWLSNSKARTFGIVVIAGVTVGAIILAAKGDTGKDCGPQNPSVTVPCPTS